VLWKRRKDMNYFT